MFGGEAADGRPKGERVRSSLYRVTVDDHLAAEAADLALTHSLRGYDAVHLAAAVAAADTFVAADQRVLTAAHAAGLAIANVAA